MDILQVIVSQQDRFLKTLSGYNSQSLTDDSIRRFSEELIKQLDLDSEHLVPEVIDLSTSSKSVAKRLCSKGEEIRAKIRHLKLVDIDSASGLMLGILEDYRTYSQIILDDLRPIIRAKMPTYEREELGFVFMDLVDENFGWDELKYA
ncbi:MAG: hypothetical protein HRU19_07760 [Pseudobacteriovorax sp.]|nr:hypothetical protein [Pseudobacteriovorax sp.]